MTDFYAPFQSSAPGGALQTLKDFMSLKETKQRIDSQQLLMQGQQSTNQSLAAKAQGDTQDSQERQAYTRMFKSGKDDQGNSIYTTDPDGHQSPNLGVILPALGRVAPKNAQDLSQNLIKTENDKIGLQGSALNLDNANRQNLQGIVQSGVANGSKDVNASLDQYVEQHPEAAPTANFIKQLTPHLDNAPDQKTRQSMVQSLASRLQPGSAVATQSTPGSVDNGPNIQPGLSGPAVTGGGFTPTGAPIRKDTAPTIVTGPNNQVVHVPGGGGGLLKAGGGADDRAPASPPANKLQAIQRPGWNAPKADQDRYSKIVNDSAQHVQDVSAAANDPQNGVGATQYRNDQILDMIDHAKTGPGMASLNWIASKIPGDSGDSFQKISHFLAQNSAAMASKMGVPNTNMGSETAAAASGNVSQNPGAIKEITRVNDALNTAFDYYNRGLAKVSGNGNNPEKVPAFKQAFGQNFDVNVFRYEDDLRRGDKADAERIEAQLGDKNTLRGRAAYQAFGRKVEALKALRDTGDMP